LKRLKASTADVMTHRLAHCGGAHDATERAVTINQKFDARPAQHGDALAQRRDAAIHALFASMAARKSADHAHLVEQR
jgi:hypothetical protein